MKRNRKFSLPSKYLLLIITIFCLGTMFVTFTVNVSAGPLKTVVGYVIVPLQNGINKLGSWFSDRSYDLKTLREVTQENKELQATIDELTLENNQLRQVRFELDRLRELYELDQKYESYNTVGARVTDKDPGNWFSKFKINKGSNEGIAVDMNVIAGGGLVGRIVETGPNWATVRAIIDDTNNVSAMVLATQDQCIVEGDLASMSENVIRMTQLLDSDNNTVVGDQVVTSHISGKYLPGILIGYVTELYQDSNKLTKSGAISPAVDFEHLEEVLVITDLKE